MRKPGRNDRKHNMNKYNPKGVITKGRIVLSSGAIETDNWVKKNTPKK